jgi:hypothetical protein
LLFGGRCEEKREEDGRVCQLGNFRNRFQNSDFFAVFPRCTGFEILFFFCGFLQFLGDPKNSLNADFSAVSRDFEGQAHPKILCGFPAMNRVQNLDLPAAFRDFYGTQKILKTWFSPAVSWDFEGRAHPKLSETRTSPQFSLDFEGSDPPKKLVNPQTYPWFS